MDKFLNKEFLVSHREQIIKAAAVIIIIVVAFFVFTGKGDDEEDAAAVVSEGSAQTEDVKGQDPAGTAEAGAAAGTQGAETRILVDVSGAVNKPAVVELLPGSRVQDLQLLRTLPQADVRQIEPDPGHSGIKHPGKHLPRSTGRPQCTINICHDDLPFQLLNM